MIKRVVIALLCVLPLGVMAQNLKFGHINSSEVIMSMPETAAAESELQALGQRFQDEMQRSSDEFNKKLQEYQQAMQGAEPLPANIAERRQKELQDLAQRGEEFQQDANQQIQRRQEELFIPIQQKVLEAIRAVGEEQGLIYIFDLSATSIPYINESQSVDATPLVKTKLGIR